MWLLTNIMANKFKSLGAAALVFCMMASAAAEPAYDLRCERLVEPVAIDRKQPRLSWKLPAGVKGQSAYRILVADSTGQLVRHEGSLWDSGTVSSDQSHLVPYAGRRLGSAQQLFWKVKAWDESGRDLGWSELSSWRMGLLERQDWKAEWIQGAVPVVRGDDIEYWLDMAMLRQTEPVEHFEKYKRDLLRRAGGNLVLAKRFTLDKVPEQALMHATAQGYYTVYLNGTRVGQRYYEPAIGYIRSPLYYDVQDITRLLTAGENEIRVVLTRGRHKLRTSNHWESFPAEGADPTLLLQIVRPVCLDQPLVKTDASWKQMPGAVVKGTFYLGEVYDSRRDPARAEVPLDDRAWKPVSVVEVDRKLLSRAFPPERVVREVWPKKVFSPASGVWVFDLGEMITGTLRWKEPKGMAAGDRVTFRYAQRLQREGWEMSSYAIAYPEGTETTDPGSMIFRHQALGVNMRPSDYLLEFPQSKKQLKKWSYRNAALPTDLVLCCGRAGTAWEGSERIHAFRYIEVVGLQGKAEADDLVAQFIHTDLERIGHFSSSDDTLNTFYHLAVKTDLMNDHGIMADCWDREKWSWNGETVGKVPMMLYSYDIAPLVDKLSRENGCITRDQGKPSTNTLEPRGPGRAPCWEQSMVQLPWNVYEFTGDLASAEENYDAMMVFLRHYYPDSSGDAIRPDGWGDHLWAGYHGLGNKKEKRRVAILGTATLYHSAEVVKQLAQRLDKPDDVRWVAALQQRIRRDIMEQFYDPERKSFGSDPMDDGYGGDSENSVAAYSTMLDKELRKDVVGTMVREIRQRDFALIAGTQTIWRQLDLLAQYGYADETYRRSCGTGLTASRTPSG